MKMKFTGKKPTVLLLFTAALLCLAGVARFSSAAYATEQAGPSETLAGVTLPQNNSYVTESYFGVIHLESADASVACASLDSKNRVVVTAVGLGSTRVTFWYKRTASAEWTVASLPLTVSGKSDAASSVSQSAAGISFSKTTLNLKRGQQSAVDGITENGNAVEASGLLWVTPSDSVISVEAKTGKITAVGTGTAVLYALDPANQNVASVTVQVS